MVPEYNDVNLQCIFNVSFVFASISCFISIDSASSETVGKS